MIFIRNILPDYDVFIVQNREIFSINFSLIFCVMHSFRKLLQPSFNLPKALYDTFFLFRYFFLSLSGSLHTALQS